MMEWTKQIFCGVSVEVPLINGIPIQIPHESFEDFGTYCGPGKLGDKFVSDDIYDVPINLACYIHDVGTELSETEEEYHENNVKFRKNMESIIEHFEPKPAWEDKYHYRRYYRIITYYASVGIFGDEFRE